MASENPYVPSEEQQEKIVQQLEEIDEEFRGSPSKRERQKHALLYELAVDPSEIDEKELIDELSIHMANVKWTDTESDEILKPRPKDVKSLYESGISKEGLELLGFDTSVL